MLTNFLKTKCTIQKKEATRDHLGENITWEDGDTLWCRKVSVDVKTRTAYMQLNTDVTDKFIFRGEVALNIGSHRIKIEDVIYELVESAQFIDGVTVVLTRRL